MLSRGLFLDGVSGSSPGGSGPIPTIATCAAVIANAPSDCDLTHVSLLSVNGCSAPIIGSDLVILGDNYPGIFSAACDDHDRCYGALFSVKEDCDIQLGADMYEDAREVIGETDWPAYSPIVLNQAIAYAALLVANVATIPGRFFDAAQKEAKCRYFAAAYSLLGC